MANPESPSLIPDINPQNSNKAAVTRLINGVKSAGNAQREELETEEMPVVSGESQSPKEENERKEVLEALKKKLGDERRATGVFKAIYPDKGEEGGIDK